MSPNPAVLTWPRPVAGGLILSFVGSMASTADSSNYTFSSANLGTPSADRTVVVAVSARKAPPSPAISSLTIAGTSATVDASASSGGNLAAVAHAVLPSGSTGNIVVNLTATALRCGIGIWTITGGAVDPIPYTATGATVASAEITVPADGCAVCAAMSTTASGAVEWTNATERYDGLIESAAQSGADTITPGSLTVTATGSPGSADMTLAVASYGPA